MSGQRDAEFYDRYAPVNTRPRKAPRVAKQSVRIHYRAIGKHLTACNRLNVPSASYNTDCVTCVLCRKALQ